MRSGSRATFGKLEAVDAHEQPKQGEIAVCLQHDMAGFKENEQVPRDPPL